MFVRSGQRLQKHLQLVATLGRLLDLLDAGALALGEILTDANVDLRID